MDSHFKDVDYGFADEEVMEDQTICGFKLNNFYVIEGK